MILGRINKRIWFLCYCLVCLVGVNAQTAGSGEPTEVRVSDDYLAFVKLLRSKDTAAQLMFLSKWEKYGTNDPELYVSYANYHMNLAKKEVIQMSTTPPKDGNQEAYAINDSLGNTVGYMFSIPMMDPIQSELSLVWLDRGIAKFPRRLDLLFGKVYLLGQLHRYDSFGATILQAIEKSVATEHQWLWSKGLEMQDGQQFLFSNCQDYIANLFNADDSVSLSWIAPISLALLEIDPKNVPCISNLAVSHMMLNQWDEAIPFLVKARELDTQDEIVISNLGYCYLQLKNKPQASRYYKLLKKSKNKDYRVMADEMLKLVKRIK